MKSDVIILPTTAANWLALEQLQDATGLVACYMGGRYAQLVPARVVRENAEAILRRLAEAPPEERRGKPPLWEAVMRAWDQYNGPDDGGSAA